ncbi:ankyrin repeat domain-containing protein [Halorhodospira halochloris]|uniref:ankyrin repeat domain-containing protein n=1 Tax=Halorhodospira halochloris TaxID=1052 RepID=UPI001EE93312|nr:ankyrin repeat domain-containing protein [Halorhodospira halochloris]MCG5549201.1 ankyrin repeat domain-containing protein [Halorhodospira halochloris]
MPVRKREVDVNAQNKHDYTTLIYAASVNEPAMVEMLLDHGADPGKRNQQGEKAGDPFVTPFCPCREQL